MVCIQKNIFSCISRSYFSGTVFHTSGTWRKRIFSWWGGEADTFGSPHTLDGRGDRRGCFHEYGPSPPGSWWHGEHKGHLCSNRSSLLGGDGRSHQSWSWVRSLFFWWPAPLLLRCLMRWVYQLPVGFDGLNQNYLFCHYPARALRMLGLLLADGVLTVGWGKLFCRVRRVPSQKGP